MKKINKGEVFVVRHIIGETARPFIQKQKEGNNRYIAKKAIICEGEETKDGFFHLRQAIPFIEGKNIVKDSTEWPRLRLALNKAGRKPVNVPGGDEPLHYEDCIAVRDFKMHGSHYFIVKTEEIGRVLDSLPLDERGKSRQDELNRRKDLIKQKVAPKHIAEKIGDKLYRFTMLNEVNRGEFTRVTLCWEDDTCSYIFPNRATNLLYRGYTNESKVVCEAPETGIKYLSGRTAGKLDPAVHIRIIKEDSPAYRRYLAYLTPNPELAGEVYTDNRWLDMFLNGLVDPALIAGADKIMLDFIDLYDKPLPTFLVYDRETGEVTKHNY